MSFLRRLLGRSRPAWAAIMPPDDYSLFMTRVKADLGARAIPFRIDEGDGVIHFHVDEGPQNAGLVNLLQICRQNEPDDWADIIKRHFDTFSFGRALISEIDNLGSDFEKARELLKVRLYPIDYAQHLGAVLFEEVADDLASVLVYDLPDKIASVHPDHVERWGVPRHDLFQLGLRNVRAECPVKRDVFDGLEGLNLEFLDGGDSFFTATHALLLHEQYDPIPDLGFLVSVPHRHIVLIFAIYDDSVIRAIQAMLPFTAHLYEEGPGSIQPSVYWWRHGVFTRLPYQIDGRNVNFSPPESFLDQVMNRVSGPRPDPAGS